MEEPKIIKLPLMGSPHTGDKYAKDGRPRFIPKSKKSKRRLSYREWKIVKEAAKLDGQLKAALRE